jgi:hypothetical protein
MLARTRRQDGEDPVQESDRRGRFPAAADPGRCRPGREALGPQVAIAIAPPAMLDEQKT